MQGCRGTRAGSLLNPLCRGLQWVGAEDPLLLHCPQEAGHEQ